MIRLRLYSSSEPSQQIDQRMIGEDAVTIGRDAAADWVISDPNRALSRRHCTVRALGNGVSVRDTSANGTFVGEAAAAIGNGNEAEVGPGGSVRIGTFTLSIESLADLAPPAERMPTAPGPSMFDPPAGMSPASGPSKPARPDPFASQLAADPLLAEHRPTDRAIGDGDAWDTRPAARAGDWDLQRSRPDHDQLIGSPRDWAQPARAESDAGFGFDAPFDRPMVAPLVPAQTGAIPADWADPIAEPAAQLAAAAAPVPVEPEPKVEPKPRTTKAKTLAVPPPVAPRPIEITPAAEAPAALPPAVGDMDDLFAAFCAGARLSPTSFAAAERAAVMTRLGEVYRGMVLGLADVMSERTALKNEYRLSRTMVRPERNNPFKWVPPQRLAIEILRGGEDGFASGTEAVTESFRDLKAHIFCVLAGMRGAIGATVSALSPARVETGVDGRTFLIKAQRDAALWVEYSERFERLKIEGEDADGVVNRAFRTAYEKQLADLAGQASGYADPTRGPR